MYIAGVDIYSDTLVRLFKADKMPENSDRICYFEITEEEYNTCRIPARKIEQALKEHKKWNN